MKFDRMLALALYAAMMLALPQVSQAAAPPSAFSAFTPDPANIKFTLPENIPWTGMPGRQQQYLIYGDPAKPGPYAMLLKWYPGQFSQPHMHEKARYITVLSGTWWMSSSPVFDPSKTFPMPAGTVVVHEANKVHWDGAKEEPTVLMIAGEGPASTIRVDGEGRPAPRSPSGAAR